MKYFERILWHHLAKKAISNQWIWEGEHEYILRMLLHSSDLTEIELYLFLDSVNRSDEAAPRPPPRHQTKGYNQRENPFNNISNMRPAPPPPTYALASKTNSSNPNTQGKTVHPSLVTIQYFISYYLAQWLSYMNYFVSIFFSLSLFCNIVRLRVYVSSLVNCNWNVIVTNEYLFKSLYLFSF